MAYRRVNALGSVAIDAETGPRSMTIVAKDTAMRQRCGNDCG